LIVGVGNSCGIGNSKKEAIEAERKIKQIQRILKLRKEKEKKKFWF